MIEKVQVRDNRVIVTSPERSKSEFKRKGMRGTQTRESKNLVKLTNKTITRNMRLLKMKHVIRRGHLVGIFYFWRT